MEKMTQPEWDLLMELISVGYDRNKPRDLQEMQTLASMNIKLKQLEP